MGIAAWLFGLWEKGFQQICEQPYPNPPTDRKPPIRKNPATGEHYMDLRVLTYNVAGLPWPFLKARAGPLAQIGHDLAEMRRNGTAPDIVLIQEGFRSSTENLIINSGYPYWAAGPLTDSKADESRSFVPEQFKRERKFTKGETFGKIMGSGLFILSEWPIIAKHMEPFFDGACAGFDSGANKGVMWADIDINGLPDCVQVFNTHLNSRGASGVTSQRSLQAHQLQFRQAAEFSQKHWRRDAPFIFGGDFNIKDSPPRIEHIRGYDFGGEHDPRTAGELIYFYCPNADCCSFKNNTVPPDQPLQHQDWQGWCHGDRVRVKALLLENIFTPVDARGFAVRGRQCLSDHDGVLVHYRLSWIPD
ncbi:MAG: hypothetical protein HC843_13210 [Sphingomonadales bacterium]|nr:hypothetical protein [Sphingomonadales bacterium]